MATWADRAPLSGRQLDCLRHLEAWASQADDLPSGPPERCYTLGADGDLVAHDDDADAPANALAPIDSMAALEQFALLAQARMCEWQLAPEKAQLRRLEAEAERAAEAEVECAALRAQFEATAAECDALGVSSSALLAQVSSQYTSQREEDALQEALRQQLAPLEESKAVSAVLDQRAWRDDAPHAPSHPLLQCLVRLDAAADHLREHAFWANSATHLAQVLATRARALGIVAAVVKGPLDALTIAAAARLAAPTPAPTQPTPPTPKAGGDVSGNGEAKAAVGDGALNDGAPPSATAAPHATAVAADDGARREAIETEVLYVRYRALASQLQPWITEVIVRQDGTDEAAAALREVSGAYWRARRTVAGGALHAALTAAVDVDADVLSNVVRGCCAAARRACRAEHALALAFFPPHAADGARALPAMSASTAAAGGGDAAAGGGGGSSDALELPVQIGAVCQPLYDELRPLLLSAQELTDLCEVVLIFRTEILPEVVAGGEPSRPIESIVLRLLQDTQERITFRVQTFVRDSIRLFKPTDMDLDYPRKQPPSGPPPGAPVPPHTPVAAAPMSNDAADGMDGGADGGAPTVAAATTPAPQARAPVAPERLWYVTVSRALSCLAQLYRCVPRPVFEGLAQEILSECAESVTRAAGLIATRKRSPLDGTLFTVAQLLTLREQIAPFDSDFAITQKHLDFSHTRDAIASLVGRGVGSYTGGLGGALELLQSGAPLLVRSQQDAKAALDAQLRAACELYITHATDAACKPLAAVLATASVPTATAAATGGGSGGASGASKIDLKAVATAVSKVEEGVHGELTRSYTLMRSYLPEPQTQDILFTPVRTNVLDALGQLETLLHASGVTPSERAGCETERLTKLSAALDAMGGSARLG